MPETPSSLKRSVGYTTNLVARVYSAKLAEAIAPLGIAPAQFRILLDLWQGDGVTQQQIVASSRIEQPTIANTLKRMERDGLITRQEDPADRRSRLIFLTDRGMSLREPAVSAAAAVERAAIAELSPSERTMLVGQLGRVARVLAP